MPGSKLHHTRYTYYVVGGMGQPVMRLSVQHVVRTMHVPYGCGAFDGKMRFQEDASCAVLHDCRHVLPYVVINWVFLQFDSSIRVSPAHPDANEIAQGTQDYPHEDHFNSCGFAKLTFRQ